MKNSPKSVDVAEVEAISGKVVEICPLFVSENEKTGNILLQKKRLNHLTHYQID